MGTYQNIYKIVKSIPHGRVMSYGQIAAMIKSCTPRMVGYAMAALKEGDVPWWRVVNAQLKISVRKSGSHDSLQKVLLEKEGVKFGPTGKINSSFRYNF